jgi:asparagine synthetase B (glutamine-hydrolysing)
MCGAMTHRGPDEERASIFGEASAWDAAIEHHRSRERPAAPVSNEDEPIWVVFNGRIYNYRELGRC